MKNIINSVISRFSDYKKRVMKRAWIDYNIKKKHIGYEEWSFAKSLYCSHRYISTLKKNGL